MNINKLVRNRYSIPVLALIIGLILGAWLVSGNTEKNTIPRQSTQKDEHEKHQIWTCSMHPQIRQDAPGQCPICGMDLIPLKQEKATGQPDPNAVALSDEAIKLAQIQTVIVRKAVPEQSVSLSGTINTDERRTEKLTARFSGRLEKLYINFAGQKVFRGQKIAEIYSPELITAQQELWDAAKYKINQAGLYQAARHKLKLWELTDVQIDQLENMKTVAVRFPILSPVSGFVQKQHVTEGNYVKEGQNMFDISPLNRLWIMLDAYESDLHRIRRGDRVNFSVEAVPGKEFSGAVDYVDPFVNPQTRVAKIRVEIVNKNLILKPGMFVNAWVHTKLNNKAALLIPKTAVLWTGKRSVVYVKHGNNFVYREIILGPEAGDYDVVISGLQEGEEIVRNGVFKVDASAQLLGKASMMNPEGGKISIGHHHGGKKMTDEEMKKMNINKPTAKPDK